MEEYLIKKVYCEVCGNLNCSLNHSDEELINYDELINLFVKRIEKIDKQVERFSNRGKKGDVSLAASFLKKGKKERKTLSLLRYLKVEEAVLYRANKKSIKEYKWPYKGRGFGKLRIETCCLQFPPAKSKFNLKWYNYRNSVGIVNEIVYKAKVE